TWVVMDQEAPGARRPHRGLGARQLVDNIGEPGRPGARRQTQAQAARDVVDDCEGARGVDPVTVRAQRLEPQEARRRLLWARRREPARSGSSSASETSAASST